MIVCHCFWLLGLTVARRLGWVVACAALWLGVSFSSVTHHHRHCISVISAVLFYPVVDSFHFRAVWILSTRRLVLFGFEVIIVVIVIVVMNITVSRSPPPMTGKPFVSGAGSLAWYTLALLSLAWDARSYMGRACCLPDC